MREPLREWKEINPPLDENNKVNWMNFLFGGWRNFLSLVLIILLVGMAMMQYMEALNVIQSLKESCPNQIVIDPFQ